MKKEYVKTTCPIHMFRIRDRNTSTLCIIFNVYNHVVFCHGNSASHLMAAQMRSTFKMYKAISYKISRKIIRKFKMCYMNIRSTVDILLRNTAYEIYYK